MKTLLGMITAVALLVGPLAAEAQDFSGHGHDQGDAPRSAAEHGYDATAGSPDGRGGDVHDTGYDQGRLDGERGYYRRDESHRRYGDGIGRRGYAEGGYHPYADGYGAGPAYSYPDEYGVYQPFGYTYSDADDAYYAADQTLYGGNGYYSYDAPPPDIGLSAGGPPADCGQWVWRDARGAYQWVARACP